MKSINVGVILLFVALSCVFGRQQSIGDSIILNPRTLRENKMLNQNDCEWAFVYNDTTDIGILLSGRHNRTKREIRCVIPKETGSKVTSMNRGDNVWINMYDGHIVISDDPTIHRQLKK